MSNNILSPASAIAVMQASQDQTTQAAKNLKEARDAQHLEETAQEFEAVLIGEMIKPMFEGLSTEGPFSGGKGEEVFRGMMIQEYGKMLAKNGGIGLSDQIKAQMIEMQEQAHNAVNTTTE